MSSCIFCKIAKGDLPSYKVWEKEKFVAFLSIQPEVEGMTLVIPRNHTPSYVVEVDDKILGELMEAVKEVAKLLDSKLENVLRTKIVFEGLEIDHLHAKLFPMYRGKPLETDRSYQATDEELQRVHARITG